MTRERLQQLFQFDPLTGKFFYKPRPSRWHRSGRKAAGRLQPDGRILVKVDGRYYLDCQLADMWLDGGPLPQEVERCG